MQIRRKVGNQKFVAENGGRLGELDYEELDDGVLDYKRTYVPEKHRGRGIASRLTERALEWARENDRKVRASCPFVADFIENHPEYQELVAEGS